MKKKKEEKNSENRNQLSNEYHSTISFHLIERSDDTGVK
jgi:hypothetical protein